MIHSIDRRLLLLAFPALGACAVMPGAQDATTTAATKPADPYSGKSVLDAAIAAAGGEAALRQVKEFGWTGTATIQAGGKTTEVDMETLMRPFTYARSTSWPKGQNRKGARTMQIERGHGYTETGVSWTEMPEAQAAHESQQFALYSVMLLVPLKDAGVTVTETAPGKDGTRNLRVEHPKAPPLDLRFDATGKLIRAADSVRDPAGGAAPIAQVATFSGSITSNGVTWPKHITIQQNDMPYFDLELATFEARPAVTNAPIPETLQLGGQRG